MFNILDSEIPLNSPFFCHGHYSSDRSLSICDYCGKYRLWWYERVGNRFHFTNVRKRCPECRNRLVIDTSPSVEMWFHCGKCKIFLSPSLGKIASESYVLKNRRKEVYDTVPFPKEMVDRNNELKERDKPAIVVDAEFHKLFCKVMKEDTGRDCKCYGEDIPKE